MTQDNHNEPHRLTPAVLAVSFILIVIITLLTVCAVRLTLATSRSTVFYEGTTINGIDITDLTAQEAQAKLSQLAADYQLTVHFADSSQTISGAEIGLTVNPEVPFKKLVHAQNKLSPANITDTDLTLTQSALFIYDKKALARKANTWSELNERREIAAQDAQLVYNDVAGRFYATEATVGGRVDCGALVNVIDQCVTTLSSDLNVAESGLYGGSPVRLQDSPAMQTAVQTANDKLELELTYHYSVPQANLYGTEVIDYDLLSQWLYVGEDGVTVQVNSGLVQAYVNEMYQLYSVHDNTASQFVTTGGSYIQVDVPASDETVDTDALFNDIVFCINNLKSGTRSAPYVQTSIGVAGTTDLGGSYIEVDLDRQHLWLYQNHELVTEGDICSGDIATGCATPTGLYTIKSKETNHWLTGEGYNDWVNYWMPFNGGIGLHDATWRLKSQFGSDVYLHAGSHGCIDMPLDLAKQVYEASEVGTFVILYGGQTSLPSKLVQTITGTSQYHKQVGDGSFYLDSKSTGDGTLTYTSSNTLVATVNEYGKVTIVGEGTAILKVTAQNTEQYERVTKEIKVQVRAKVFPSADTQPSDVSISDDFDEFPIEDSQDSEDSLPDTDDDWMADDIDNAFDDDTPPNIDTTENTQDTDTTEDSTLEDDVAPDTSPDLPPLAEDADEENSSANEGETSFIPSDSLLDDTTDQQIAA